MDCAAILNTLANIASIATAVAALFAYGGYLRDKGARRRRLEDYLANEKRDDLLDGRQGARSVLHLMGRVGLTEQEVFAAAFGSTKIRTHVGTDEDGKADRLLFQFKGKPPPKGPQNL